jgi:hypothetical protein
MKGFGIGPTESRAEYEFLIGISPGMVENLMTARYVKVSARNFTQY